MRDVSSHLHFDEVNLLRNLYGFGGYRLLLLLLLLLAFISFHVDSGLLECLGWTLTISFLLTLPPSPPTRRDGSIRSEKSNEIEYDCT
jgi:hypothetical protein